MYVLLARSASLMQGSVMEGRRRTALVIGASSVGGLGEAVARRFADEGISLVLAGRRRAPLETLAKALRGKALVCDITDEEAIAGLVADSGPFDILVNAAGTSLGQSIAKLRREQIESQLTIHITANLLLLKHAVAAMSDGGSIVLFSSITASLAGPGLAAYAAAKAGLNQIVRIAAVELGQCGIRVNAVAPGFSRTPMTDSFLANPRLDALYRRESALDALVSPAQVAATVAHLAASDCFISGEIIHVSGGAHLGRLPRADELKD